MKITDEILDLINAGALFVCNHSGGKDSQAMYIQLSRLIPEEQLIVVHADLGEVEWEGTLSHIYNTIDHPLFIAKAKKSLLDMVESRGMFPSPKYRQCTSDLKRDPIAKVIRNIVKDRDNKIVVNCIGIRADESSNRAKKVPFKLDKNQSKAGRTVYEWYPIFDYNTLLVFATIKSAGQEPHWAYSVGMSRLSCCFCIMASDADLKIAAKYNPKLLAKYDALERKFDQTMMMPVKGKRRFLTEIVNA